MHAASGWTFCLESTHWEASTVGNQICQDLRSDPSGGEAVETLKACFGTKSPNTLLKRAATLCKYLVWHYNEFNSRGVYVHAFPLVESDVWNFFKWLRVERQQKSRGFTTTSTFLETVRFCKFTVGLQGCDEVLGSGRLLGFAAVERREKGPSSQAPILELVHLKKLHEILSLGSDLIDRLGAGAMLVCIYGRAPWSDLRYIDHVDVEARRNGSLVLYTRERNTSAVGIRREQYLPLVIPWEGVVSDDWIEVLLKVYEEAGLDMNDQGSSRALSSCSKNRRRLLREAVEHPRSSSVVAPSSFRDARFREDSLPFAESYTIELVCKGWLRQRGLRSAWPS